MLRNSKKFVRNLTANAFERRQFDTFRRIIARRTIALVLVLSACDATAAKLDWQPTDEITATAEAFLKARIGDSAARTTVQAGNLDSRHRLAYCSVPLVSFLRRGAEVKARTIVGVRCNGAKPWKVYVPVDVIVTETVLVAKRSLPRGHILTADDLVAEQRDVSRLISGYVSDPRQLLRQRLKTQLIAGKVLTPAMLQADVVIRRGQTVTLTVGSGSFAIRMSGTALMDGALNQRIRVENSHSGRVIEGFVRSQEHVEVLVAQQ